MIEQAVKQMFSREFKELKKNKNNIEMIDRLSQVERRLHPKKRGKWQPGDHSTRHIEAAKVIGKHLRALKERIKDKNEKRSAMNLLLLSGLVKKPIGRRKEGANY